MKKLVIVESPAKAKTINKYLGDDYIVKASMGHVRDLPPKKLGVDVDKNFMPEYVNTTGRAKVIAEIKAAAKKCDHVFLAPDPDREGEAIAWHLFELLKDIIPAENFSRVTYNEITKSAITEAFANPSEMDMNRVNSQQARRVLDRLVGFKVSPLLWKQIKGGVSAGRVQSVALRLVCEREQEIKEFNPEEYWVLGANVRKQIEPLDPFAVKLSKINGKKAEVNGGEQAEQIRAELEASKLHVAKVIEKTVQRKAQAPFITSTIQQAASSVCGFAPARTMRIAQGLYENGLITYMRTDSFNIAKSAQAECAAFVTAEYGAEYLPEKPNFYKSKGGAQEAHEAIRPTDVTLTPQKVSGLDKDEAKLYKLIWERFVASQMVPAKIARRTAEVETDGENTYQFRATASEIAFPGYMRASGVESAAEKKKEGEEDDAEATLPPLTEGEAIDCLEWTGEQKFTKPPARYSEPSLIKALEENGVGRPSTYAQTLSTIEKREYVNKEKRQLVPTESGIRVNDFLVKSLDPLFNVKFTAEMEEKLDKVEEGTVEWTDMMGEFYTQFLEWLEGAKDMADPDETIAALDALKNVSNWDEPVKRGRRTYDDAEIVASVREKFEEDGKITARQQQMIFRMACKYLEQMPQEIITGLKLEKPEAPRTETGRKIALLEGADFDEPRKVGRRTYDDGKFVTSLKQQVQSGKRLSDRQVGALDTLLVKYAKQIPDFEKVKDELGLTVKDEGESAGEITKLMDLCKTIETWNPPVKRGNREFNDQDFFNSLTTQFEGKGTLSPRQVAAFKKMMGRYKEQIPTYEQVREELGLPAPRAQK
jgi:DNA topoisomerase-1